MSDIEITSHAHILALWGDQCCPNCNRPLRRTDVSRELGEDLGVSPNTARMWLQRGRVPIEHWQRLIEVAKTRFDASVTYDELARGIIAVKSQDAHEAA